MYCKSVIGGMLICPLLQSVRRVCCFYQHCSLLSWTLTPSVIPPPPAVNLGVLNNVCTRMHQQPFQLQDPSDTGDLLQLVEDLEKVKKNW